MQIQVTCADYGLQFWAMEYEIPLALEEGWHCPSCCGVEDDPR